MPGTHGLRAVLEAAAARGVPKAVIREADAVVQDFAQLIADAGGSQERLHSVLSDQVPEIRRATELRSRAAVYKGMADLLGHATDALVCIKACQPNPTDPRYVDVLRVHAHFGLRRLRRMAPLVFEGARLWGGSDQQRTLTLDGCPVASTPPDALLIAEHCHGPTPRLQWVGDALLLDTSNIKWSRPIDLAFGFVRTHNALACASNTTKRELIGSVPSHPAKLLVQDCLVREDLWRNVGPLLCMHRTGYRGGVEPENYDARWFDALDHVESIQAIGRASFDVGVKEIPAMRCLTEHALRRAGWDVGRFAGYRVRVVYPVLERQVSMVFDLPDDPIPPVQGEDVVRAG